MYTDSAIIKPATFQLLKKLLADSKLDEFFLVGGTALALQFGHRLSIDLDLFRTTRFDQAVLADYLEGQYGFNSISMEDNTLLGFIDNIKSDFISHAYPLIYPMWVENDVRMAHPLDIAAMKLNAINRSGQRQKDFYDIYYLLERFSLSEMVVTYQLKYPRSSTMMAIRALTYFVDVNFEIEPPVLINPIPFTLVQERLRAAAENGDLIFK